MEKLVVAFCCLHGLTTSRCCLYSILTQKTRPCLFRKALALSQEGKLLHHKCTYLCKIDSV